ncbi:MAG TPA: hypothetical protein VJ986_04335 [Gaiellaceae bacterium]|nr:hypothetical protein [Gaiellaceae bacterium]
MWQTYAIDGRRVEVERAPDGTWHVRCAGSPEVVDADLRRALAGAVGPESGVLGGGGVERSDWRAWIDDHARQIEGESTQG